VLGMTAVLWLATPVRADIDPTGSWDITIANPPFGTLGPIGVNFRRSGTNLTADMESSGPLRARTS
jgi:hypothetical protein